MDKPTNQTGTIIDYISGREVRETPEEKDAVQVFAHRLVDELGYPKEVITTRPQHRVRAQPSGSTSRGYPVDIAVFRDSNKIDDQLQIVVECKRGARADGEKQLKTYLQLSSAEIGVWFNGNDHLYIHKKLSKTGRITWVVLPTLPRYGQDIDDIGALTISELTPPTNLRAVFRDIRNFLAGNAVGMTRDQALAQEIMSILFCKIFDELDSEIDDPTRFRVQVDDQDSAVKKRVDALFAQVKRRYPDVFTKDEEISLDPASLRYVVGELQNYRVTAASRDAIGDAFEVFIGPAVRGEEGQFFTPRNVVELIVRILDPKPGERVIDPACGSGGFLVVALDHIWKQLDEEGRRKKWKDTVIERRKQDVAMQCIRGLDKDMFLAKLTKAYMAIVGDGRGGIFCQDSLAEPSSWGGVASSAIKLGEFDVVLTNPPFGSKIKVKGAAKLAQYQLAHKWKLPKDENEWASTAQLTKEEAPQILFIERCIQLLRPGGRLGIVLPESIFGMPKYAYVVQWILDNLTVRAFISLPEEVFQPYTHAKTCVLVAENTAPRGDYNIEMAVADWCGHDSRGNQTVRVVDGTTTLLDDLPLISSEISKRLRWGRK